MTHIMIVQSPYYQDIAAQLLSGATAHLDAVHATYEVFDVAGALEIAPAIKMGARRKATTGCPKFDGYIAIGCVLRGETTHYDIVCSESARGLTLLAIEHDLLIGNAILTCETAEQAQERADPRRLDKGADAARGVLSLLDIKRKMDLV